MKNSTAIFIIVFTALFSAAQQPKIDSLKHELTLAKEDTNKVNLLTSLSDMYAASHADTGLLYAQQALDLAEKLNYKEGILLAEGYLAICLIFTGNSPLGLDHAFKTLSLAKKINPIMIGWANSLISYSYYYLGDYNTCLKYTLEGVKVAQPFELPYGWRDLSVVYHRLNEPDSAMLYARKAHETLKSTEGGNIFSMLGDAYAGKAVYDSALLLYRDGVSVAIKQHTVTNLIDNYNGFASVYKAKNNLDSAAWYSDKVLAEKIEKRYPVGLLKAANMLTDIYGLQEKPDSTLKYLRMAVTLKDSLFSREKTMAIQTLAFKEEEKRKEFEASELRYKNRLRMYSLSGGLIALLIIAGILLKNNRNKQKTNALLQQQKEKAENALLELESTQIQLIQSEKMASLGELTAGIAHEIQNPLNFVNNFSEVNNELLTEMNDAIVKGNYNEVATIAKNVIDNQEKINHHGKRADAIVKGMLQHSRTGGGQKELTDINMLADEYLRLSYHGLRAKDKTFNATLETDFDNRIGKINIIPQDIGRVILNLINNAFQAVGEKQKQGPVNYDPTVTIKTLKNPPSGGRGAEVLISVRDNGPGIPQKILDKIFQPFFTTKPTGQGTGLGLSLAYDIVKAHGGEIKVATKEGDGSEFIIQLPTN